ncbi:MAG: DUF1667 domain-containing protein [Spirochaetaceae bacterium]|nr:DUF1667 domain-containing protein [Spirochaetaceae bacterium]
MKELTCIVCPIGCALQAEEGKDQTFTISGNRCPRGAAYAQEEIRSPRRVLTATCAIDDPAVNRPEAPIGSARRLPVKSSQACPREKLDELLQAVYRIKAKLPVQSGDALIRNWNGTGIDIVATRSLKSIGSF